MDSPKNILIIELVDMFFPKDMAYSMVASLSDKMLLAAQSPENNLPAFYIDDGEIILIDVSLGLKKK